MISLGSYQWLQVEATTKCNAWCPGCARNKGGYELVDHLVLEDLRAERFQQVLSKLPGLTTIDFCGTHGDAIAAANILELINIAKEHCSKIIIRTNGSLRSTTWWQELYRVLSNINHEVWFCLDGLAGTHEYYRQGTDFSTVINNAKTFINAGGTAVWQFIPWAHNERELKECIRFSQDLGFKRFEIIKNVRTNFTARHYKDGQIIKLSTWSKNKNNSKYEQIKTGVIQDDCQHLSQPGLYLNANGLVSNCCYFNINRATESLADLPDIAVELAENPNTVCMHHCGSCIN